MSYEDRWINKLELVKQYIDKNNAKPSKYSKDKNTQQLGYWIYYQQPNNKKKYTISKPNIYEKWTEFINHPNYAKYFMSHEDTWINNFELVKQYIDKHNTKPSKYDKDKETQKLGYWIVDQQSNHNNKKYIMANSNIYNKWKNIINDPNYAKHFMSHENRLV